MPVHGADEQVLVTLGRADAFLDVHRVVGRSPVDRQLHGRVDLDGIAACRVVQPSGVERDLECRAAAGRDEPVGDSGRACRARVQHVARGNDRLRGTGSVGQQHLAVVQVWRQAVEPQREDVRRRSRCRVEDQRFLDAARLRFELEVDVRPDPGIGDRAATHRAVDRRSAVEAEGHLTGVRRHGGELARRRRREVQPGGVRRVAPARTAVRGERGVDRRPALRRAVVHRHGGELGGLGAVGVGVGAVVGGPRLGKLTARLRVEARRRRRGRSPDGTGVLLPLHRGVAAAQGVRKGAVA